MRLFLGSVVALVVLLGSIVRGEQRAVTDRAEIAKIELPHATVGPAAGKRDEKLEVVALVYGPMPAGVAVTGDGRIFLTFPRWSDDARVTAAELAKDGKLIPFPNGEANDP